MLWSKGGESVITAGIDGNVRIWEVATGKKLREIRPAGAKSILCTALSGDGELLVAGDAGGRVF